MFRTIAKAPRVPLILVASFLCPTELSLYVADLRLPPHRLAIIALLPFAAWRMVSRPDTRIRSFDILFLLYAAWTVFVFHMHGTEKGGLVYGGSIALESFGGYLVARAYIRDLASFRATLDLLVVAAMISMLFAWPETILGKHLTHDFLQSVTGYEHPRVMEQRLGLTRAYGLFDHPIHLGTFAAAVFGMIWFTRRALKRRIISCGIIVLAALPAVASAPLLCIIIQTALAVWDKMTRKIKGRIAISLALAVFGYAVLSLVANRSPVLIIATGLTIDSWTGYYRTLIWQHGLENVWQHPWFGIGLADWERPWWMVADTIDAYWLVVVMRTGIPALMILLAAVILLVFAVAKRTQRRRDPDRNLACKAWLIGFFALSLIACTVHYWNVMHAYFFFFMGLSGWLADPIPARYAQRRRRSKKKRATRPEPTGSAIDPAYA